MVGTSARLLRLLSLLQSRRSWPGSELASTLAVTERTVRRDVDKLRTLGYPVQATAGVAGGYRLAAGTRLPPLLLDDGEALAVAFGLRSAAVGTVAGMEQAALRALDKLGKVLPERLRRRVAGLNEAFVATPFRGPRVNPDTLLALTAACEERRCLRFGYEDGAGRRTERDVEPLGVVHTLARWYLVCWDRMRTDYRTFRVDRVRSPVVEQERFVPRPVPLGDLARFVEQAVGAHGRPVEARVEILAGRKQVARCLPSWAGELTELAQDRCLLHARRCSLENLAFLLGNLEADFVVREPDALVAYLGQVATRLSAAHQASIAGQQD